jgi:hypothetical protein
MGYVPPYLRKRKEQAFYETEEEPWKEAYRENRMREVEERGKYKTESKLIPKPGGYSSPPEYVGLNREGRIVEDDTIERGPITAIQEVPRPRESSVEFEAQPEGPTRAHYKTVPDMYMTHEGRRKAKEYAGTEEEMEQEAEGLAEERPSVVREVQPKEKTESKEKSDEEIIKELYGD